MKERILPLLVDPVSGEPLKLIKFEITEDKSNQETSEDIVSGILLSESGNVYPIYKGIPRLLVGALWLFKEFTEKWKENLESDGLLNEKSLAAPPMEFQEFILPTLKRFEKEWSEHELNDKTWGWDQTERINRVKEYMGWSAEEFRDKLILDAGAGTGQLTCSIAKELNCEIIGMDLSPAIIKGWIDKETWAGDNHLRVHMIQADVNNPPFKEKCFDGIHSSGVLHHTPNTKRAFDSIAPLTKVNGRISVWLYKPARARLPLVPFVKSEFVTVDLHKLRKYTTRMNPTILWNFILVYAAIFHLFYKLNELVRGHKHAQTIKERVTSIFDTLAPPYAFRHTEEEVKSWYEQHGFRDIFVTDKDNVAGFNMCGTRGPHNVN